ncbi:MAG TPA: FAD-dependent oxidoreductase [Anaerolineae bacterium]|nr:FAD-dependent oxidoreductase [Anaerolineae bacterium]
MDNVVIIGGGLSGLMVAYYMEEAGVDWVLVEARPRYGGRIYTTSSQPPIDLGPTWFWEEHQRVRWWADKLGLAVFEQTQRGKAMFQPEVGGRVMPFQLDWQEPIAYRLEGGMGGFVTRLVERLPTERIMLGTVVEKVVMGADGLSVVTNKGVYGGKIVFNSLPPQLAARTIKYKPDLPMVVYEALTHCPTWMGNGMKVGLAYRRPFWREKGLSGYAIAHGGPVNQFQDASPAEAGRGGALFGWIGDYNRVRTLAAEERERLIVAQAVQLFGALAQDYVGYYECNWGREVYTAVPGTAPVAADGQATHGHPLLQAPVYTENGGGMYFISTETAKEHGGYLEGAIRRVEQVVGEVIRASRKRVWWGGGLGGR